MFFFGEKNCSNGTNLRKKVKRAMTLVLNRDNEVGEGRGSAVRKLSESWAVLVQLNVLRGH